MVLLQWSIFEPAQFGPRKKNKKKREATMELSFLCSIAFFFVNSKINCTPAIKVTCQLVFASKVHVKKQTNKTVSVGGCFHVISAHNYSSGLEQQRHQHANVRLAAASSERQPGCSRQAFAKRSHILRRSLCRTCQCLPMCSGNDMLLGFPWMRTF